MLPALDWDPTELAGEGTGERGDGVPVFLAMHGEGAWATLKKTAEVFVKSTRILYCYIFFTTKHRHVQNGLTTHA